jgi:thiamine-phosphate pyrophosphorylase
MKKIDRLHYITQDLLHISHAEMARKACMGGVKWVQLRVKNKSHSEWISIALEVQKVCAEFGAKLIINDNVALAKEIGADGVHLGKIDMKPKEARAILGDSFIIGGTANSMEDAVYLSTQAIDYIGLGPFRFTTTKQNLAPVLGAEGIKEIVNVVTQLPIIAIGGITIKDTKELLETGAHGIAVSSTINLADNIIVAATALTDTWKN